MGSVPDSFDSGVSDEIPPTSIYVLFVIEPGMEPLHREYPDTESFSTTSRFPLMWLGTSECKSLCNLVYDKRSVYTKFKNHLRYYSDYMEVFKFVEMNSHIVGLTVRFHCLEKVFSKSNVVDRLCYYLLRYRMYHGDRLILTNGYRKLMQASFEKSMHVPRLLTSAEQKKLTIKKYVEAHREQINEKSRRWYESHKEVLKERRDAKKNAAR